MTKSPVQIGVQFIVKVWSPIDNSPDTTLYGHYRLHTPRGTHSREQLAGAAIAYVREVIGLRQQNLAVVQAYDRNGHEILHPNFMWDTGCIYDRIQIERICPSDIPALVDASRTIREVMALPLATAI